MKFLIITTFILWVLCAATITADPIPCCEHPNTLNNTICMDGRHVYLTCQMYAVEPVNGSTTLETDEDDNLLYFEGILIPRDSYCLTTVHDGVPLALVCGEQAPNNLPRVICILLSVFLMALTIVVYYLVPDLRDLQGECTLNSIWGLAFAFVFLGMLQMSFAVDNDTWCQIIPIAAHVSFIFAFFWLNIVSIQIWRSVVKRHYANDRVWRLAYYCYGCGGSLLLLILLLIGQFSGPHHLHPGFGETKCWFKDLRTTFVYFYGPIAFLICANVFLFVWTSTVLWKDFAQNNINRKTKTLRYRFCLYTKLFFIMGLSWIFEVLSAALEGPGSSFNVLWSITDYINMLQGVLIFVLLVVTRKRALRGLAHRKFCGFSLPEGWRRMEDEENDNDDEVVLSEEMRGS